MLRKNKVTIDLIITFFKYLIGATDCINSDQHGKDLGYEGKREMS